MRWKQALDRAYLPTQIEALDPQSVVEALAAELPDPQSLTDLEARDAQLATALETIDAFAIRTMKVRLDYALADDSSLPPPTRNMFAQTIVTYADDLALLAERARDIAARGRAAAPDVVAERVASAARATLDQRAALRDGVLVLVARLARTSVAVADRFARDSKLDEPARKRWSAVRRDLETIAQTPAAITAAPMATRIAAWPEQIDDAAPVREPTLAELLELD